MTDIRCAGALANRTTNRGRHGHEVAEECRATTVLAGERSSGRAARSFVECSLEGWGWPATGLLQELEDILLMTSELAINAADHAGTPMEVTASYWPCARVRVEVRDEGAGLPSPRQPGTYEESGRGLALVDLLSDGWGVLSSPPGKVVWFELGLS